nr:MAG TPA: hypothetical protein [Caudoviricetes sp.]
MLFQDSLDNNQNYPLKQSIGYTNEHQPPIGPMLLAMIY